MKLSRRSLLAALLLTAAAAAPAQVRVAAGEALLAVVRDDPAGAVLYQRSRLTQKFDLGRPLGQRIIHVGVLAEHTYVFLSDGRFYRYAADPQELPTPLRPLPGSAAPLDVVTRADGFLALAPSRTASATQPGDGAESSLLAVFGFDGRAWNPIAPLPPDVTPAASRERAPRLAPFGADILLTALDPADRLVCWRWRSDTATWVAYPAPPAGDVESFWVVGQGRTTLIVAITAEASARPRAWRLESDTSPVWTESSVRLGALPAGLAKVTYRQAVEFNQHLCFAAEAGAGRWLLQFARLGDAPIEPTLDLREVFHVSGRVRQQTDAIQLVTYILLIAVMVSLFTLRRSSMTQAVPLPPGYGVAFLLQRVLAFMIDFTPFALSAAWRLDVSWRDSLNTLSAWSIDAGAGALAIQSKSFLWWALAGMGFVVYATVMEAWTGRTVGKVVLGLRILNEQGQPPHLGQILVRNLSRVLELLPQFWVFALLMVLSRSNQRLGDIYARTVVVRRVTTARTPMDPPPAGS